MVDTSSSQPHRLERPFAALMGRLGITDADIARLREQEADELARCEVFAKHAAFERHADGDGGRRYDVPSDCPGDLRVLEDGGVLWPLRCDVCGFEVSVAIGKVDPGRLVSRRLERSGIPEQFLGREFEKGDPDQEPTLQACRIWLRSFKASQVSESVPAIALWGRSGRGKSHLLSLMVEALIRSKGADAVYRSAMALLHELRSGFDHGNYEVRWQRVLHVPVLALDDLGAERFTEWQAEQIAALVDYRYSRALPLLIATNIPPAGWEKAFGERTASRLRGMCVRVELAGKDRRVVSQASLLEGAA